MKTILLVLLLLLGGIEVFAGLVGGPLAIYAKETPFGQAIGINSFSDPQAHAFWDNMRFFKNQWSIVAWFGLATMVIAVLLYLLGRMGKTSVKCGVEE